MVKEDINGKMEVFMKGSSKTGIDMDLVTGDLQKKVVRCTADNTEMTKKKEREYIFGQMEQPIKDSFLTIISTFDIYSGMESAK